MGEQQRRQNEAFAYMAWHDSQAAQAGPAAVISSSALAPGIAETLLLLLR